MKIRISIDDLRKGKFNPSIENNMAELCSRTISNDQARAIAQFLYEVLERSKKHE